MFSIGLGLIRKKKYNIKNTQLGDVPTGHHGPVIRGRRSIYASVPPSAFPATQCVGDVPASLRVMNSFGLESSLGGSGEFPWGAGEARRWL